MFWGADRGHLCVYKEYGEYRLGKRGVLANRTIYEHLDDFI